MSQICGIDCGVDLEQKITEGFWLAEVVRVDLANKLATISYRGWKSKDDYESGKQPVDMAEKQITGIDSLACFETVWQELSQACLDKHFRDAALAPAWRPGTKPVEVAP